jgi:hypothetical protein
MILSQFRNEKHNNEKAKTSNNGYNSLLLMNTKRQTFYIFNLISLYENPNGFVATKS